LHVPLVALAFCLQFDVGRLQLWSERSRRGRALRSPVPPEPGGILALARSLLAGRVSRRGGRRHPDPAVTYDGDAARVSQRSGRIVRERHDEPRLEGRRITLQFVTTQVADRGLAPRTDADRHDLDVAAVYRALTDSHDSPAAMRAVERQRDAVVSAHDHLPTDPEDRPPELY
jgi:hypothetical protein